MFPLAERAQLSSLQSEIAAVSSALRPRTLGLLRRQHSVLHAQEWRWAAQGNLRSRQRKLHATRASCVREASQYIYPMEVEPVTVDDEGDSEWLPGAQDREIDITCQTFPKCCVEPSHMVYFAPGSFSSLPLQHPWRPRYQWWM